MAVVFLVALFVLKTTSVFKNKTNEANEENTAIQQGGLTYGGNEILGDLVSKDTDLDGILDWEESLWGTDPTKRDTNDDGTSDFVEIEKLRAAEGKTIETTEDIANLTQTDKFSRELFVTVATLSQGGEMDQATVDKISESLAGRIQNSTPRKIFMPTDIKVIKDDSLQAINNYNNTLDDIHKKYPVKVNVMDILQKFMIDENNVDVSVLAELNPIIEQTNKIIDAISKMSVPQSIAPLHLDFINGLQRLSENVSDIKLYETDVIVSLGAISQYEQNTTLLESATNNLANAIKQKLNN